jgi:hypothetical protein
MSRLQDNSTIELPYKFIPRDYQLPLFEAMADGFKRLIYVAHRRAGKDKTIWNIVISEAFQRVGTYYYILPTYSQAKKVIWDNIDNDGFKMMEHIPKRLIDKLNETEMQIELKNGSIIQLVGADNVDRIVGTNPVGVVFSEFSITKPEVWDLIRPILAANGGWAIFNFTPRGMNHAYTLIQKAKEFPDVWWVGIYPVSVTHALTPKELEQERLEMPQVLFEQEYECKFLEGASQFFKNVDNCVYTESVAQQLQPDGEFKLGVDLAKYNDFTVITPFNLSTFTVYPQDRFNQVDWILQEAKIEAAARRFNNARVTLDSTGIGDPVVEELKRRGLNIREDDVFKFTQNSRTNLLNNLAILFENGKIRIPPDEGLRAELASFTIEMNEKGKAVIKCPDGLHDDRVMSLALAVWGVDEKQTEDPLMMMRIQRNRSKANEWM